MNRKIFVDTGAWKAYIDQKDADHPLVAPEFDRCRLEKILLVTTDYVVSETLTLLRMRPGLGHGVSVAFGKMAQSSQAIQIDFVSSELFQKSWNIFERYGDKDFSFVDCVSFAVMENRKIREVIAVDHHFAQYGFEMRPKKYG